MVSIDQVLLLQKKVESAVQKIVQLKAENDALRSKCSELTNALSEKSELLASFTADEKKIEDSILGALDRLNTIENNLLDKAGQKAEGAVSAAPSVNKIPENKPASPSKEEAPSTLQMQTASEIIQETKSENTSASLENQGDTSEAQVQENAESENSPDMFDDSDISINAEFEDDDSSDSGKKFDIF